MSRKAEFFTISLNKDGSVTDYSVEIFLESIREKVFDTSNRIQAGVKIDRVAGKKWIRIFPYIYTHGQHHLIIPFGKFKDKNKPYWINDSNNLEQVPAELFDINTLGYDPKYKVMLLTTNREGPTAQNIEEYLNTFVPKGTGLCVKIDPIMYNAGIENVRNAEMVRSITFILDLWQPLNNFYLNEMQNNRETDLMRSFKKIANIAKDEANSKVLALTMGLGIHGKKRDSLNLESMLHLLNQINIGEEFVREIIVSYKNGAEEHVDTAKLKQADRILSYLCKCEGSQISPVNLAENIDSAITEKVINIVQHNNIYYKNIIPYDGGVFEIVKDWHEVDGL